MIRTIDTQMMIQQSLNASRVAGEKLNEEEQNKAFQAEMEQERATQELETVIKAEQAEDRRIQDDGQDNNQNVYYLEEDVVLEKKPDEEEAGEAGAEGKHLNAWNMGAEVDISV